MFGGSSAMPVDRSACPRRVRQALCPAGGVGQPVRPLVTPIFQGLGAVTAHVKDIQKARTFYAKTLGLRELNFDPSMKAAYYEIPGATAPLAIHQYDAGCKDIGGRPPGTVSGIVFTVADVKTAVGELQKRGVAITDPTMMGGAMAAFADPDGNEFVLNTK